MEQEAAKKLLDRVRAKGKIRGYTSADSVLTFAMVIAQAIPRDDQWRMRGYLHEAFNIPEFFKRSAKEMNPQSLALFEEGRKACIDVFSVLDEAEAAGVDPNKVTAEAMEIAKAEHSEKQASGGL